jgi:nucleoside-diphosphate-sugar epimerase
MKRILITGATGYIGSNIARCFTKLNYVVSIIKRPSSNLSLIKDLLGDIFVYEYNGSFTSLKQIVKESSPSIVIHLASCQDYKSIDTNIEELIESNIHFGTQLLEAMKCYNIIYFINTLTYWQFYKDEEYNPINLYAATKQAFVEILKYYVKSTNIKCINLIIFDVYGPNDPRNKLFTQINNAILNNTALNMTDGYQFLDYVHIDDVVRAFVHASKLITIIKDNNVIYKVSSNKHIRLRNIVNKYLFEHKLTIKINWGALEYMDKFVNKPYSGGLNLPGWEPTIDLMNGLATIRNVK